MSRIIAAVVLSLAARCSAASTCSGKTDCGSCADHTAVLGVHTCHWCEVDQMCHDVGSAKSACAPSMEDEHCVCKASMSSCSLSTCPNPLDAFRPRHLHLAIAGPTGMRVAWKTRSPPKQGCSVTLTHGGSSTSVPSDGFVQYLVGHGYHHVTTLKNLIPGQKYSYTAVCDQALSEVKSFHLPAADLETVTALVIGDMGTGTLGKADASRTQIGKLKDSTDLTVHVGDISYADDDFLHGSCVGYFCYEAVYDQYMTWMQDVMDSKPYMVLPGNHESECHSPNCLANKVHSESLRNFSAYNARWAMPSKESGGVLSMWHSFDYGPIHFVACNSETDFPDAASFDYGDGGKIIGFKAGHFAPDGAYLKWLEADLAKANANRAERPFIVAMGHRTWINKAAQFVTENNAAVRKSHEPLFVKYGVDLYLSGHQHSYSSQLPVAGKAATPVVVTGAAGCDEGLQGWDQVSGTANGYKYFGTGKVNQVGTLEATRSTLTWKAYNSKTGTVFDTFTLPARAVVKEMVV